MMPDTCKPGDRGYLMKQHSENLPPDRKLVYEAAKPHLQSINTCACGNSEAVWGVALFLLEMAENQKSNFCDQEEKEGNRTSLSTSLSNNLRWVEFGAKVIDSWGWIEHGYSIGGSWLTEKGKAVLDFLRMFGVYDDVWPEDFWDID